jgi:hypothetical protein
MFSRSFRDIKRKTKDFIARNRGTLIMDISGITLIVLGFGTAATGRDLFGEGLLFLSPFRYEDPTNIWGKAKNAITDIINSNKPNKKE